MGFAEWGELPMRLRAGPSQEQIRHGSDVSDDTGYELQAIQEEGLPLQPDTSPFRTAWLDRDPDRGALLDTFRHLRADRPFNPETPLTGRNWTDYEMFLSQ